MAGRVQIEDVPEDERGERLIGRGWPVDGVKMVGWERLTNLQRCIETVLADDVPGDIIETGVWRGGATILARSLLLCHGADSRRRVWAADSFVGLPAPDASILRQTQGTLTTRSTSWPCRWMPSSSISSAMACWTEGVRFLKGWFSDTLPTLGDETWSILRLDGDMYESTYVALEELYPRVSSGGFVIVDDYGALETSRQAVTDYRANKDIDEPIQEVDWTGVYWRKR